MVSAVATVFAQETEIPKTFNAGTNLIGRHKFTVGTTLFVNNGSTVNLNGSLRIQPASRVYWYSETGPNQTNDFVVNGIVLCVLSLR